MILALAVGCGGGGGGGGGADAAVNKADAKPVIEPDAKAPTVADGLACTATQSDPTGGCPAGYGCLASGCAQACMLGTNGQPNNAPCTGYTGPGYSQCFIALQDQSGKTTGAACGIFCADSTGQIPGCKNGACDGTCPNTLNCVQHPNPMAPQGVKICQ